MALVELRNINKFYGEKDCRQQVLKDVSLKIEEGEMISVMGPSGSGKSTLLNIIGLLDRYSEGEYKMDNRDTLQMSNKELANMRNEMIGFIFQNFNLMREFTTLENVQMALDMSNLHRPLNDKLGKKEIKRRSEEMLEAMGLKDHLNKVPAKLSGGQQQRVAIARALINEPKLILADEPTGALDQKNGEEIMNTLLKLNKEGKTIVVVTHDQHVADFCEKHIYMRDGVLSFEKK